MPKSRIWIAFLGFMAFAHLGVADVNSVASLADPLDNADGGARATGMGSAFVGVADDSTALMWNPAGLGGLRNTELSLNHNSWLAGIIQETAIAAVPVGNLGTFGFSGNYVNYGSLLGYDSTGAQTANYTADSYGFGAGWGKEILPGLSAGLALNAVMQTIASTTYSDLSAELGVLWCPVEHLRLGASYSSLGTNVAGYSLASTLRLGGSYRFNLAPDNQLLLAASAALEQSGENSLQFGGEDLIHSCLALRAGYQASLSDNQIDGVTGLSLGIGILFGGFSLDYAYLPFGDLGIAQRISLSYEFGQEAKDFAASRS
jgi:hypothetical protein